MAHLSQEHIYLRALRPGDGEELDGNSDTAFRFTSGDTRPIPDLTRLECPGNGPIQQFSFAIIAGHRLVGEVICSGIDLSGRQCRLTMGIARKTDRNQGIGSRALHLALTYAFYSLGMEQVTADTSDQNPQAIATLINSGFRLKGTEPGFQTSTRVPFRHLHYTITLDDFNELKNRPHQETSLRP